MNKQDRMQRKLRSGLSGLLLASVLLGAGLAAPGVVRAEPQTDPAVEPQAPTAPAATSSIYLPAAQKEACRTVSSPGLGGFQVYGGTAFGSPYYNHLMESGATWIRQVFSWAVLEPENTTPENFDWKEVDVSVQLAAQKCWTIILTLEHNPDWASSYIEGTLDKTTPSELAQVMAAVAERYDGDGTADAPGSPVVRYFEMYNEPDAGTAGANNRWGNAGDEYAAMLKAVYPAIKNANPQAQVVFGGIAYDFFTDSPQPGPFVRRFFDDVLANGGGAYFDLMNYHFYPLFGWNWTKEFPKDGPGLVEKTESLRGVMRKYNVDKPIIITETGWHNNAVTPFGSDTRQIRLLVQIYAQAKAAGVPMVAWWPLADPTGSYIYKSGLVTAVQEGPVTRKPAYAAYQVFMRELGTAKYVGEVQVAVDVKVYQFRNEGSGRTVYVAWTNPTDLGTVWGGPGVYQDTTRTTTVTLNGRSAKVYDARWSEVASVSDGADGKSDGKVTVTINGDPKYIVIGG
jgi:hypothetical protein